MKDLAVVVFSCDKNEELWPIFKHCIDKYWKEHPPVYLLTETIRPTYIKTICHDIPLEQWTKRIRMSLAEIPYDYILFICDDCFLNKEVNYEKMEVCMDFMKRDNVANINLEMSFDREDIPTDVDGIKQRSRDSRLRFIFSMLCGLWNKKMFIDLLSVKDCGPWELEQRQEIKSYDYYQICDEKVISWFRDGCGDNAAIRHGKWMHGIEDFLKEERMEVDFSKKGFWSYDYWERYWKYVDTIHQVEDIIRKQNEVIRSAEEIKEKNQKLLSDLHKGLDELYKKEMEKK